MDIESVFLSRLSEFPEAKAKYDRLPESHKNEYVKYITEAKRESTMLKRINKSIEMIIKGR